MRKLEINWLLWVQGLLFIALATFIFNVVLNFEIVTFEIGRFFSVISPVIVAAVMAYLLSRPCDWLEKWYVKSKFAFISRPSRGLAVASVYLIAIGIVVALFMTLIPLLFNNVVDFVNTVPYIYSQIETFILNIDWSFLDFLDGIYDVEGAIDIFFTDFDVQVIVGPATAVIGGVTNFAIGAAFGLFDFVLALIISIYFLLYKNLIFVTIGRITRLVIKKDTNQMLKYYIKKADDLFYKFIGAQFLDACIMGGLSIILLWALNVRFAVFLGVFLGIANMIPKFGSIVASIVVIALTFVTGNFNQGVWTAILLTALQQIDGNVIGPMITGDALKINPILVFLALLIGAHYGGLIGMILAIPVAALVKIIIMNVIEARESKEHHYDRVATKIDLEKLQAKQEKAKYKNKAKKPGS